MCRPNDPKSQAILSKPHPNESLRERLVEALTPKEHGLKLSPFDLKLAAQYQEAHAIIRTDADNMSKDRLSYLHFVMQPIKELKAPSKHPSLFELFIAYKTCLLRAVLDPSEARECMDMMMLALQNMDQKGMELEKEVTLKKEATELLILSHEIRTQLQMKSMFGKMKPGWAGKASALWAK
ncbi:MAG: hypothetical protein Q9184_003051 [Pyrenodesmia sp. 2 TL-2023]